MAWIFRLSANGMNATEITRELSKRKIPTPGEYKASRGSTQNDISRTHGRWCASSVLRILEDERYIGTYVIGKRAVLEVGGSHVRMKDRDKWFIIPDHHPAIVDKEVFEQSREKQHRFTLPAKKKQEYPLRSKVFCGCCAHVLARTMNKNPYYQCRHAQADVDSPCYHLKINVSELEQAVFTTLKTQIETAIPLDKKEILMWIHMYRNNGSR